MNGYKAVLMQGGLRLLTTCFEAHIKLPAVKRKSIKRCMEMNMIAEDVKTHIIGQLDLRIAVVTFYKDGYATVDCKAEVDVSLADFKEFTQRVSEYAKKKHLLLPMPLLIDISLLASISREAKMYIRNETTTHKRVALVTKTPVSRTLGNICLNILGTAYPMKMFTDKQTALTWLLGY